MAESTLFKTSLNKSMALCSKREYCINDIQLKLESWGVGMSDSEKIISTLIKENFIKEERFASAFVKDKFIYNKWGKVKISAHLRAKRIPADVIRTALDSIDSDKYASVLNGLINSHKKTVKAKNKYDLKAKLLRYGLSKGFESSLVYDVLNSLINDPED
jgi:regulatory protein